MKILITFIAIIIMSVAGFAQTAAPANNDSAALSAVQASLVKNLEKYGGFNNISIRDVEFKGCSMEIAIFHDNRTEMFSYDTNTARFNTPNDNSSTRRYTFDLKLIDAARTAIADNISGKAKMVHPYVNDLKIFATGDAAVITDKVLGASRKLSNVTLIVNKKGVQTIKDDLAKVATLCQK